VPKYCHWKRGGYIARNFSQGSPTKCPNPLQPYFYCTFICCGRRLQIRRNLLKFAMTFVAQFVVNVASKFVVKFALTFVVNVAIKSVVNVSLRLLELKWLLFEYAKLII
jgi:hypothetical protein